MSALPAAGRLTSLTIVTVANDDDLTVELIQQYIALLDKVAVDFDFVIVANAPPAESTRKLKLIISAVPDLTVIFLNRPVHDDVARLVGIEHAVGDWILLCDMALDDPMVLSDLIGPAQDGYDLVVGDVPGRLAPKRPLATQPLLNFYMRAYAALTGVTLERQPTGMRLLSRAAALYLASQINGPLMVRAREISQGFPATSIEVHPRSLPARRGTVFGHPWHEGLGMLLSFNTMPLRWASYVALSSGVLSIIYSIYVFITYLLKPDIAAGWTTLSLQVSVMMFGMSIVLLIIGEYVIQIHSSSPPRSRRSLVLREIRSATSRRSTRLNIVDEQGKFELGKPSWLMSSIEKA